MTNKSLYIIVLIILSVQGVSSCTCNRVKTGTGEFGVVDPAGMANEPGLSETVIEEMTSNIASPIEMASLFKSLEFPFSSEYLAATGHVPNYNTDYAKAFNLGIFGADLGYLNMYGKTSLAAGCITAMKTLADGIDVGRLVDYSTLNRLAADDQHIDSLIYMSQQSFNKMEKHLQQSGRGELSALMVAGAWIEGLYLSTRFLQQQYNNRLKESIGEQKIAFEQLLLILRNYQDNNKYIADMVFALEPIRVLYDGIEVTIEAGEPKMVEIDGIMTTVQTETSTVHYSKEQMQKLIAQAEILRNTLIQ